MISEPARLTVKVVRLTGAGALEDDSGSSCASALPAKKAEAHRAEAIAELNRMMGNERGDEGMKVLYQLERESTLRRKEFKSHPHGGGYI